MRNVNGSFGKKALCLLVLALLCLGTVGAQATSPAVKEVVVPAVWIPLDADNGNAVMSDLNTKPTFPSAYGRLDAARWFVENGVGDYYIRYMSVPFGDEQATQFIYTDSLFFTDRFHRVQAAGLSPDESSQPYKVVKVQYGDVVDESADWVSGMSKTPFREGVTMYLSVLARRAENILSEASFKADDVSISAALSDEQARAALVGHIDSVRYFNLDNEEWEPKDPATFDKLFLFKYDDATLTTGAFLGSPYTNFMDSTLKNLEPGTYEAVLPIYWEKDIPEKYCAPSAFSRTRYKVDDTIHFTFEIGIGATKTWKGIAPVADQEAAVLKLFRAKAGGEPEEVTGVTPVREGVAPTFTYTWLGQPADDGAGNAYIYTVQEDGVAGGKVTINDHDYEVSQEGSAITNTRVSSFQPFAEKVLTGRDGKPLEAGEFQVMLSQLVAGDDGSYSPQLLETAGNVAADMSEPWSDPGRSWFLFKTIDYKEAKPGDSFYYHFKEVVPDPNPSGGVLYSTEEYYVKVFIKDDGSVDWKYELPPGFVPPEPAAAESAGEVGTRVALAYPYFENEYSASGSYSPLVTKLLEGRKLKAEEFSFTLTDVTDIENPEQKETVKNAADGKVSFTALKFTNEDLGERNYEIKEQPSGLTDVTDDGKTINLKLTIGDNYDGTLKFTAVYTDSDSEAGNEEQFKNVYTFPDVVATKAWVNGKTADHTGANSKLSLWRSVLGGEAEKLSPQPAVAILPASGTAAEFTFTWSGLPAEDGEGNPYTYSVQEDGVVAGKVLINGDSYAVSQEGNAITNTYEVLTEDIVATKTWSGGPEADHKAPAFTLKRDGVALEPQPAVVISPASGTAASFTYTWAEQPLTDADGKAYAYTVEEEGVTAGKLLVNGNSYAVSQEGNAITNTYEVPTEDVVATKAWSGGPEADHKAPAFTLKRDGVALEPQPAVVISPASGTAASFTYTWAEQPLTDADGKAYAYTVEEEGVTAGKLLVNGNTYGVAAEGLKITNTYEPPAKVTVELTARKAYQGATLEAGLFSFQLLAEDKATVLQDGVKNAADGSVSFDPVAFEAPGEYQFHIKEVKGSATGVSYDAAVYSLRFKVSIATGNKLEAELTELLKDGAAISKTSPILFTNKYTAPEPPVDPDPTYPTLYVPLRAKKVLHNGSLQGGDFSFLLKDGSGRVRATVSNAADGTVVFPDRGFSRVVNNYIYTITEKAGTEAGMSYDGTVYRLRISTRAVDGKLEATIDVEKDGTPYAGEMVFTNRRAAPPTGDSLFMTIALMAGGAALLGSGALLIRRRRDPEED